MSSGETERRSITSSSMPSSAATFADSSSVVNVSIEAAGSVRSSANTWKWYYDRVAAGPGVQLSLQSGRSAHSLSPAVIAPFSATRAADESIRGSNSVHERSAWLRLGRRDGPRSDPHA